MTLLKGEDDMSNGKGSELCVVCDSLTTFAAAPRGRLVKCKHNMSVLVLELLRTLPIAVRLGRSKLRFVKMKPPVTDFTEGTRRKCRQ